jgi:DNA-binding MarR family transcriptional regulator
MVDNNNFYCEAATMPKSTSEKNQNIAYGLSNNFPRLLREFYRDFERKILDRLASRGYGDIRASHSQVFANLGMGAVRVTELAERAQVTQQAMGKMLKELERLGYITREVDDSDRRAREIRLTQRGIDMTEVSLQVIDELYAEYADKVGAKRLTKLENQLREAVGLLELTYLPESWQDASRK